ncbi:MAG: ComEC/Rec2 family competence protein [Gammaproteobacteria bacterium]
MPTARSVVAVGLLTLLTSRRRTIAGSGLMAAVVLIVLLIEPLAPLVPGWLSFAGVAVLVAVGMLRYRQTDHAFQHLKTLLLTQLCMTVGLAPLMVLCFSQLPLAGGLANLVAVPAFSLILLPLTLLGTLAVMLVPDTGAVLLGLAADGFDLWRFRRLVCRTAWRRVYFPDPGRLAAGLALGGAVLLLWPRPCLRAGWLLCS